MTDPARFDPNIDQPGASGGTGEIRQDQDSPVPESGEDVARREAARAEAQRANATATASENAASDQEAAAARARQAEADQNAQVLAIEQRADQQGGFTQADLVEYRAAVARSTELRTAREAAETQAAAARAQATRDRAAANEAREAIPEVPGAGAAEERYKAAQNASPRQCYQVAVPHANTRMTFGASAGRGGSGASLTTDGSIMLDSAGPTDVQAAGNLSLQTNAGLAAVSDEGTLIGTKAAMSVQAGESIKVWAGSSVPAGPCGTGAGANVPKPNAEGPSSRAEKFVAAAMLPTAIGKTAADLTGFASGNPWDTIAAAGDTMSNVGTLVGTANTLAGGSGENGAGHFSETAATWGDNISAVGGKNIFGAIAGTAAATGAAGAGEGTKVDIQGPSGISMLTNAKITGTATNNIEFKTAVKFSVNAASVAEMVTQTASIFGMIKSEMKGGAICNLMSFGIIGLEAPAIRMACAKMNIDAVATYMLKSPKIDFVGAIVAIRAKTFFTVNTPVTILDSEMKVQKQALFKNDVDVKGDTSMKKNLSVKEKIKAKSEHLKEKLEVLGKLVAS
ncbi:MAG: hypothetical protein U0326_02665 [Polyangiales bacterium]